MPKASKITMDWGRLAQQNPNLAADLDRLVIEEEPERCFAIDGGETAGKDQSRVRGDPSITTASGCRSSSIDSSNSDPRAGLRRASTSATPKPKEHGACANPDH